jgi:hypothetical protein
MKKQQRLSVLLALGLAVACSPAAFAGRVISTFDPGGADTELRESAPTIPRGVQIGTNSNGNGAPTYEEMELGMRVQGTTANPTTGHNGHIYMKWGVSSVSPAELLKPIIVRTHWQLRNLGANRIEDVLDLSSQDTAPADGVDDTPFADRPNVAFDYYVLDPNHSGADWDEATTAYLTVPPIGDANAPNGSVVAPGLLPRDGNYVTKDLDTSPGHLTYLGQKQLRSLAHVQNPTTLAEQYIENGIPAGEAFEYTFAPGSALHLAIAAAQLTGHQTVTLVTTLAHDGNTTNPGWINHNYIFMSKEKANVSVGSAPTYGNLDGWNPDTRIADYDPNTAGNQVPNSPWQGQLNTQSNPFAPQLEFVPEPGSMMLAGLSGLALLFRRRMA